MASKKIDVEAGKDEGILLECCRLSYTANDLKLLNEISARFEPGTLTALMGPSGAGKTTFLTCMGGRDSGTRAGAVLVDGEHIPRHE